jgi:hypothetical protein
MPAKLMYGQKTIMPTERTISSWAALEWRDEMSQKELLAARIRQLERRPEDMERVAEKLRMARMRNKERFDRTRRLRPKKIEEGDWVLMYDSSLDNQHKATRKFARRWFGPYVVMGVNDNGMYHLGELDGTRIAVPVVGKRVKTFKKQHGNKPDLETGESDNDDTDETGGKLIIEI